MDYRVRYYRLSVLLEEVAIARGDGSYKHLASRLRSKDLLIIDDFGLAPIPSRRSRELLDLLDDRVGVTSTIIASQLPMADTYRSFEDPTVADAILDRIVHSSITVELKGESMRKRLAEQSSGTPDGQRRKCRVYTDSVSWKTALTFDLQVAIVSSSCHCCMFKVDFEALCNVARCLSELCHREHRTIEYVFQSMLLGWGATDVGHAY